MEKRKSHTRTNNNNTASASASAPSESMLKKIQALLALAARGGTPEEAATAMARAQALMSRYHLDAATLGTSEEEEVTEARVSEPLFSFDSVVVTWIGVLAQGLAKLHNVATVVMTDPRGGKKYHRISMFGRKSDMDTLRYVFDWLRREIDDGARRHKGQGRTWLNNYRLGFVHEVMVRMKAAKAEAEAAYAGTSALAIVQTRYRDAERAMVAKYPRAVTVRRPSAQDRSGRATGARDGAKVKLETKGRLAPAAHRLGSGSVPNHRPTPGGLHGLQEQPRLGE